MADHKVIFAGPVGAGKTTAIQVLSDKPSLTTDAAVSDSTVVRKATTTVAMDYGCLALNDTQKVHLYGTPGQVRFRFMWELLADDLAADCAGLVLLLDNTRNSPYRDLKYYTQEFANLISRKQLIIGVTRSDVRAAPAIEDYEGWVRELSLTAKVVFIDARQKRDLVSLLQRLMNQPSIATDWQNLLASIPQAAPLFEHNEPMAEAISVSDYHGETLVMKDSIVDDLMNIKGVQGAALSNAMGDMLTSSLDDPELEDFIGFMAGIVPVFEQVSDLGTVQSVVLKSERNEHLSVYIEQDQALGVLSSNRTSVRTLRQQVDDMLQWG